MLGQSQPPKKGYLGLGHVLQQWSSECGGKLGIIVPCVGSTAAAPGILGSAKLPTDQLGFAVLWDLHRAPSAEDLAPWVPPQDPARSILLHAGHHCWNEGLPLTSLSQKQGGQWERSFRVPWSRGGSEWSCWAGSWQLAAGRFSRFHLPT